MQRRHQYSLVRDTKRVHQPRWLTVGRWERDKAGMDVDRHPARDGEFPESKSSKWHGDQGTIAELLKKNEHPLRSFASILGALGGVAG